MALKEAELQREMHAMEQKTTELKELSGEKNRLNEELNLMSEEIMSSKVSFSVTNSLHCQFSVHSPFCKTFL